MKRINSLKLSLLFILLLPFGKAGMGFCQSDPFTSALSSLKDGTAKIDSLNKLCRTFDDNSKVISSELTVIRLAEKITMPDGSIGYKRGIAQAYNNIGIAYKKIDTGEEALKSHLQALKIREELLTQAMQNGNSDEIMSCKKDISASYTNIGNTYDYLDDKKRAIEYQNKSLAIKQELKDTLGMARSYDNIASIYLGVPDYYKAIDYSFKAVELFNAKGEKSDNLAKALNNIGEGYRLLKEFDKALNYYQKALNIQQELGDKIEIARVLNNIGVVYLNEGIAEKEITEKKKKFVAALENYLKALGILEETDDKSTTAVVYNNIGNTYWELNDFSHALEALTKSLTIRKKIGIQSDIAKSLNSLATHFSIQKKQVESTKYALQALTIADSTSDPEQIKTATEILSNAYFDMRQFEKSLFYYKRFVEMRDKITDIEGAKNLAAKEERMEADKRELQLKEEHKHREQVTELENKRQRVINWAIGVGLVLVVVFAGFIYNRFRFIQKQNQVIEQQMALVDEQNAALELANNQIEQKNKDITDSIQYAKRIQRALLASDALLNKHLRTDSRDYFVFYKPKDIVSGDFYWASFVNNKFLLITADCTGHGVPGAFMSLLNISLLNEITLQRKATQPDVILNSVREQIISTLNPEGTESESKDGMDCILCTFDFKKNEVEMAAANNPLWIVRADENGIPKKIEYAADKQPVGFHSVQKPFTHNVIPLQKGDIVYSFTDGYADQFGGPKGKKYKRKNLEDTLLANSHLPMPEQKRVLEKSFEDWKGPHEQVDDVLVIGIRI